MTDSETCRLFLVPEDVLDAWRQNNLINAIDKPEDVSLARHSADIAEAIEQEDLPPHDQNLLVQQRTGKFLNDKNLRRAQIWQEPASNHHSSSSSSSPLPPPPDPLQFVPDTYRARAKKLLEVWERDKDLSWDEWGNVQLRGKPLRGTTVTDLLHHAVSRKRTAPAGFQDFNAYVKTAGHNPGLYLNPAYHVSSGHASPPPPPPRARVQSVSLQRKTKRTRGRPRSPRRASPSSDVWDLGSVVKRWETID
jgi:hypothetical protein